MPFASLRNLHSQWFPPSPKFTEKDLPCQKDRVFLVTGGNAGVGFELCKILYGTGATIYMASRSKEKAEAAISAISAASPAPSNPGRIQFLRLDLNDLNSVKEAAATFAQQETKLDVLWNNAGTGANMVQPGAKTQQGFEAMVGMHCIATLLFTELLLPQLRAAVASSTPGFTRVVWTASFLAEGASPPNGIDFSALGRGTSDRTRNYAVSKAGTWMIGREYSRRHRDEGIVSVIQNPGNLRAGTYAGVSPIAMFFINPVLHDPKFGAYTEMYAGLSSEISQETNGAYVIPWGRIRPDEACPRKDIVQAIVPSEQGGLGYASKFWDWCEEQWKPFV
ncbi:Short-chain dehydrogenase/reductase SDR [Penicillium hispanicum]|uniref:Short-chain dehydrogenase/reductase SDR n=1 Tax=Penicillium hispanicum TaxID=1080232 RepID=UPI00254137D3|nr:Short-chain dehydrogenase/reductase SDR [Penicillium hispanicum]KAJ5578004.1 Short-chain dehydrogenase/reductase SDR [Penicillium hispanicum]